MSVTPPPRLSTKCSKDVYLNIFNSSRKIWEAQFNHARDLVEQHSDTSLSGGLAFAEIKVWLHSLENCEESFNHAMEYYNKLEEDALQLYELSKPSGAISSFFGFSKKDTPKIEKAKKSDHIEALVTLGDISGGMAMLLMKNQHRMKGAYRLRKAWKYYQEAFNLVLEHSEWKDLVPHHNLTPEEENSEEVWKQLLVPTSVPENLTADELRSRNIIGRLIFGKGLFCYSISMLPKSLQWLVELIGFSSDGHRGLADVLAATKVIPSPRAYWARAVLGSIRYFVFDETKEALSLVEQLLSEINDSPMLYMTLSGMYRVDGKIGESSDCYKKAHNYAKEIPTYQLTAHYELGHNYFLLGEWNNALPLIEDYINNCKSPNFKAFGGYKLGICYWQSEGDSAKDKIISIYKKVINEWTRPRMSYDTYAARKCTEFIEKSQFTELDILFIEVSNSLDACLYDIAKEKLDIVKGLLDNHNNISPRALYLYYNAHMHQKTKEHESALHIFNELLQLNDELKEERWILAYAELESIDILIEREDYEKAQKLLNSVKNRSNFDFEKHVSMRVKKLQGKISRNMNK